MIHPYMLEACAEMTLEAFYSIHLAHFMIIPGKLCGGYDDQREDCAENVSPTMYATLGSKQAESEISFRNRVRGMLEQFQFPATAWSAFETPLS
mmetsp:Transcript_20401/g.42009  ORF Transcript_20401/g.42009 Transcript_20401/m.42009 type:complete len:94 (+) Transcript_20401:82-363(+)